MSRKLLCKLLPVNVERFVAIATANFLPILEQQQSKNKNGESVISIWIDFNHTEFAKEVIIPAYNRLA